VEIHIEITTFGRGLQVATAVKADWLFLLTDVDALYTTNPATNPDAQPIHEVHDIGQLQVPSLPPPHFSHHLSLLPDLSMS